MNPPRQNRSQLPKRSPFAVFRERRPPVLVVSHERSGTHFLMNSIARGYGYTSTPWVDMDGDSFFDGILNRVLKRYVVFYIHRDPVEVMLSFWRFMHRWHWHEGPKRPHPLAFASAEPEGQLMRGAQRGDCRTGGRSGLALAARQGLARLCASVPSRPVSWSGETGLVRWASKPASSERRWSSTCPYPVIATRIGSVPRRARMRRATS